MDAHVHDRRRFLALTAGGVATPFLAARGGFGGGNKKSDADVLVGVRPRDLPLTGPGHELTGSVDATEVLGRSVVVTVRLGGQQVSLVAPRADTTGQRPDDPVRLTVRPENLLLFEADGPQGPGRLIGTR